MRSQFLTILCIFSFLSCTWGVIESSVALYNPEAVAETPFTGHKPSNETPDRRDPRTFYEDSGANSDNPMPEDPRVVRQLSLAQLVYSLVALAGVVLMFFLRRIGFYIYVIGVILGFALPLYFVGLAGLGTSFTVFFSVLFAVMYGFCLREMK
ncbi:hypothetical protein [Fibrella forsythiae]|uniref:Uncharacterized protein n=1 Tax=Fibrella forsythiae TaxID=2817061 RepID=A0ABS3JRX9_9BACT|nr:hypothetical protein [Fibrella forsythiae]MBO0952733.1 hypothetical protein [Fibrella forsythiae]